LRPISDLGLTEENLRLGGTIGAGAAKGKLAIKLIKGGAKALGMLFKNNG